MTIIELKAILESTGLPVAYSHFTAFENSPVPEPPYICYMVNASPHFMADNKVFKKIEDVSIELYTNKKDLAIEAILEEVLDQHSIPYIPDEVFIPSEQLFQKIYDVRLI
ncbi:hypothetical protein [Metabacillus idriensis]|uniref:hypothetical protein n=1 Tax=Metabacillus idriensis TaxID=324768 RepID=UPI0017483ED3|nr:hypothetical protein [Metabacillus idriensis]